MGTGDHSVTNHIAGRFEAYAYESITVSTTVKRLTLAKIQDDDGRAKRVQITNEDNQLRYRYDGEDPTSSEGHVLNPFDTLELTTTTNITNLRMIRKGSSDAKIRCTFER